MNYTSAFKYLEALVKSAEEVDEEGNVYFTDITIPACEVQMVQTLTKALREQGNADREQRIWDLYCLLLARRTTNTKYAFKMSRDSVDAYYKYLEEK